MLPAVITDCLQGELEVVTLAGTGKAKESAEDVTDRVPFLMLGGWGGGVPWWLRRLLSCASMRVLCGLSEDSRRPHAPLAYCTSHPHHLPPTPHTCAAGLDLPAAPLFKDALEKVIIPQVGNPAPSRQCMPLWCRGPCHKPCIVAPVGRTVLPFGKQTRLPILPKPYPPGAHL